MRRSAPGWRFIAIATVLVPCLVSCAPQDEIPPTPLTFDGALATGDSAIVEHGARMVRVLGCTGCHRPDFSGGPFNEVGIAPNLSLAMARYTDAELDRAIREGIARDGRALRLMPSEMYRFVSDADIAGLVAYLRQLEPTGVVQPPFEPSARERATWELAHYVDAPTAVAERLAGPAPVELGPRHARGRYLARALCTECHGGALEGVPGFTPDLSIVATYSDDNLGRLFREGRGVTRDDLGLMSLVAPARFAHLTPGERADLAAYLRTRAQAVADSR